MMSLQAITVKSILENLAINDKTIPILIEYLQNNKNILSEYLNKNMIYHVYYRQEDPFVSGIDPKDHVLLKSFIREEDAVDWIIKNGRNVIQKLGESCADNRIVLTIIPSDNTGIYECGEEPTRHHYISGQQYLNFAFSSEGYSLLLRENMYTNDMIWHTTNLTWIHFYKEDGSHIIGASIKELETMEDCEDLIEFYR